MWSSPPPSAARLHRECGRPSLARRLTLGRLAPPPAAAAASAVAARRGLRARVGPRRRAPHRGVQQAAQRPPLHAVLSLALRAALGRQRGPAWIASRSARSTSSASSGPRPCSGGAPGDPAAGGAEAHARRERSERCEESPPWAEPARPAVTGEERDGLYRRLAQMRPAFAGYEKRTDRIIPVFRLTRVT